MKKKLINYIDDNKEYLEINVKVSKDENGEPLIHNIIRDDEDIIDECDFHKIHVSEETGEKYHMGNPIGLLNVYKNVNNLPNNVNIETLLLEREQVEVLMGELENK